MHGDHSYDGYARPHRTLWAGLEYLLFRRGPVASTLFETGGFWYGDRGGTRRRDGPISSSISASAPASRRESRA
jgi:hypothetical protein